MIEEEYLDTDEETQDPIMIGLPLFDGKNGWERFIETLWAVARYENWDRSDCLYYLRMCLMGDANSFVSNLSQEYLEDVDVLCGALE